jgi:hypothetical protein
VSEVYLTWLDEVQTDGEIKLPVSEALGFGCMEVGEAD